ncbi:MAG TPA: hypothetical protein VJJ75_01010 [Candidatus Nanoarchaeia archaeon]|nr:hypothetical protein [Candidatus Nanoarchaeia archaeon]
MRGQTDSHKDNHSDDIDIGKLIKKHGNKLGIPVALIAYGGIRGLADIVLSDGIVEDGIMPIAAAYISSCVGHQITPGRYARFLATSIGPVMAGYEFAGYLKDGLEWLLSGMQEYVARPIDHPGDAIKNAAKSVYNKANELLGRPLEDAEITKASREQGVLEKCLETAKDQLRYVHWMGTAFAAHYLRKFSRPVREQFLRQWEKPSTFLERLGQRLGLRQKEKAKDTF